MSYGIKETLDCVKAIVELANVIDSTKQDGFQLTDIVEYVKALALIPAAVKGADQIPMELYDLDDEERQVIVQEIEKLEFESEYNEFVAEQAIRTVAEFVILLVVINLVKKEVDLSEIWQLVEKFRNK